MENEKSSKSRNCWWATKWTNRYVWKETIMEVNLTTEQQEYVDEYTLILNRLSSIQERIIALKEEADTTVAELNELRLREREAFPEQ